jgi:metal-sulfur cluster biosynthetic enzyme
MALTQEQETQIRERLMTVYDPELGIDIVNLGLVYGIDRDDEGNVLITMTLTSPGCPVQLVWQPRWDPRVHCSEEAKLMLGIWD